jgi:selenide,water dikinase
MMEGSGVSASLDFDKLPVFDQVMDLIKDGEVPGGSRRNLLAIQGEVDFGNLSENEQLLAADAQTSGGLLVSLNQASAEQYVREMHAKGHIYTTIIGKVIEQGQSLITF